MGNYQRLQEELHLTETAEKIIDKALIEPELTKDVLAESVGQAMVSGYIKGYGEAVNNMKDKEK